MTKPKVKSTNNVFEKVQSDKNYKRIVFKESSDEEDDYHVLKEVKIDKNKNYKRIVFKGSSDEKDDHIINESDVKTNKVRSSHKPKDDNEFYTSVPRLSLIAKLQETLRKRKLSFDRASEFDLGVTAPPKIRKVEKPVDFSSAKQETSLPTEEQPAAARKRFPSLSKGISLVSADLTKSVSSAQNVLRSSPFTRIKENESQGKLKLVLCDSESDSDDANSKPKNFWKRKFSFDNTSEFQPEDNSVPPKITKVEKPVDSSFGKSKIISLLAEEQPVRKSFLASLSKDVHIENADSKAMDYRVNYASLKEELCKVLYKLFNEKVFDNKLPQDMTIEWSVRLLSTAGKFYYYQPSAKSQALGITTVKSPKIVLSTKILNSPDKLRGTLIHEMCHAGCLLVDKVKDGHGNIWKAWVSKAMQAFPELPPIYRLCKYGIQTKYTYKCINCGKSFGRQIRSIDLNRKCCRYCHGKFKIITNKV